MIEQQIRPWNVLEMKTLDALAQIRREDFVPEQHQSLAFADVQIPIGDDQVMLEPKVGARMVENLGLTSSSHLLQIGTGTGYLTALSAQICQQVTAIETDGELANVSKRNLSMAGFNNVHIIEADCFSYIADQSDSFDGILITGSIDEIPTAMLGMLQADGRLVGIRGNNPAMQVVVMSADGSIKTLFETSVLRLKNVVETSAFEF